MTPTRSIDLNCDLGEAAGHDAQVMPLISSANIASGGHAGDRKTMTETVMLAREHGVAIGCHPGHADRPHFGRRMLPISPTAAADLVAGQLASLAEIAGDGLRHLKLHGSLYHQVGNDEPLAVAVSRRLAAEWPHLLLFAASGSRLAIIARDEGLRVAAEAFADRRYTASGSLLPRSDDSGLIAVPETSAAQAVAIATTGCLRTACGADLFLSADTICVHGDGPDPAAHLRAIHEAFAAAGILIQHPAATTSKEQSQPDE
jgi:UPF0271 protein